ncbi:MAG: amidohydrolase [Candidatus Hatepunaea meridiana]|nr:amidohydrolase [Candidatus Hatepunaea meridiana]
MQNILLTGGRIFAGLGWDVPSWYDSLLIKDGKIASIGSAAALNSINNSVDLIQLNGALVLPGLCDAHIHLMVGGQSLQILNLEGLDRKSVHQVLLNHAKTLDGSHSHWIKAFNWEPWRCDLDADFLDSIFPGRNVVVFAKDLHSCCCSSTLLSLAGITRELSDPPGWIIVRDVNGFPNGILREGAAEKIHSILPPPTTDEIKYAILKAQDYLLSLGLTAVSEVLDKVNEHIYRSLDDENKLKIDIDAWLRIENWEIGTPPPHDGKRFRLNTLKLFLDGSLGSRTAALNEPYLDDPDHSGVLFYTDEELYDIALPAVEAGWRLAIHSIGDRAVAQACKLFKRLPRVPTGPHRIEHAQVLPEDGVRMIVESGAVASVQPVHLIDDQRWLPPRIGAERCKRTSIWRSLFEAGVPLALGSDWPVASPDPLLNIHAAINRCGFNGEPSDDFELIESLPPYLAIRAATYGWAYATGLSDKRGSIAPGQSADLTIISGVSDDLHDWSKAKVVKFQ